MSPFMEVMIEATAPWALIALTILLVTMSHERDHAARFGRRPTPAPVRRRRARHAAVRWHIRRYHDGRR